MPLAGRRTRAVLPAVTVSDFWWAMPWSLIFGAATAERQCASGRRGQGRAKRARKGRLDVDDAEGEDALGS